jgi:phosphoglycolate phosphatase
MNPQRPFPDLGSLRLAVFDFDGTLSLLREGWATIMARQGLELLDDPTREAELELEMLMLSGKPSIVQMQRLVEIAQAAGRPHPTDAELLQQFQQRLAGILNARLNAVAGSPRGAFCVPGASEILDEFKLLGIPCVLLSGTKKDYVLAEAELLGVLHYFGGEVYAPEENNSTFTKIDVLTKLMKQHGLEGAQLIGFGDGYAETVAVQELGGYVVGLATRDIGEDGLHPMKEEMLYRLGADIVLPNYLPLLGDGE